MTPRGLAGKLIRFFAVFTLVMGVLFLGVFASQLLFLHNVIKSDEADQQTLLAGRSEEAMTVVTEANLKALIQWAADRTDDEFWIAGHNLKILRKQVADIYRNPQNYGRRTVEPPRVENAGKPALQLLCPNGYENITPEAMERAERVANVEPMLREFLMMNDFYVDIGVATMDGLALDMDRLSEKKVMDDGSIISLDVTDQIWYKGAVERGDVYFYPIHSILYDFDEVAYAAPVYVDDELVAILEGSIQTDLLRSFLNGRDLGKSGFTVIVSDKGELVCSPRTSGELLITEDLNRDIRESVNPGLREVIDRGLAGETGVTKLTVDGEAYYAAFGYMRSYKWAQIIFVSVDEVMHPSNELLKEMDNTSGMTLKMLANEFHRSGVLAIAMLIIFLAVAIAIVGIAAKRRVRPIALMAERVAGMTGDNITFDMLEEYKTGDEIQILAESFEQFSVKTRRYIDEIVTIMSEKERVKAELSLATKIQADMLPAKFPAFPDRHEFDIYASMTPAKEVGGDFYDFFFAGENKLAMIIADVSGKGVPAAMFMMMAKTMIQGRLIADHDVAQVLVDVNNAIFESNREKMFVTVWAGILDVTTGVLTAANAGHEYPILKEPDGDFEIIKDRHGFVIGARKNMKYTGYEIQMKPGSKLFVYTDGVPEATNEAGELFGMERTLAAVNGSADAAPEAILANVAREVGAFVGEAEQFDDLTMLCIEYHGPQDKESQETKTWEN